MDEEILLELRKEWGEINTVAFKGQDIIFRALRFEEFDEISRLYDSEWDSAEAEDAVVTTAIIYPENFDLNKYPAGLITSLADEILIVSGFRPGDEQFTKGVLEKYRLEMQEFRNMMKAFIIAAMPSYTEEDLDKYTFSGLARKLALAEKIIEIQQSMYGIEGSDFRLVFRGEEAELPEVELDPEEVAQGKPPAYDPIAAKLHQALMG